MGVDEDQGLRFFCLWRDKRIDQTFSEIVLAFQYGQACQAHSLEIGSLQSFIIDINAVMLIIASRIITLILILALTRCAGIQLISEYDKEIDIAVTAFQKKITKFLISLEKNIGKEKPEYRNNTEFYDEIKIDLSAIKVRAAAIPKNEITIKQINLLIENVSNLEKLHKLGITPVDIPPLKTAFNTSCTAILKLELAKKRGKH